MMLDIIYGILELFLNPEKIGVPAYVTVVIFLASTSNTIVFIISGNSMNTSNIVTSFYKPVLQSQYKISDI